MAHTVSFVKLLFNSLVQFKNKALHFTLNGSIPKFSQVLSILLFKTNDQTEDGARGGNVLGAGRVGAMGYNFLKIVSAHSFFYLLQRNQPQKQMTSCWCYLA